MTQQEFNEQIVETIAMLTKKVADLQNQVNQQEREIKYATNRIAQLDSMHF